MKSPYLSTVEEHLAKGIEGAREAQMMLEDFLSDYHFVDGLENSFPNPVVFDAIQSIEKAIVKLKSVEIFVKGINKDE